MAAIIIRRFLFCDLFNEAGILVGNVSINEHMIDHRSRYRVRVRLLDDYGFLPVKLDREYSNLSDLQREVCDFFRPYGSYGISLFDQFSDDLARIVADRMARDDMAVA